MSLSIKKLSKSYGNNPALKEMYYEFTPEVYGLLGPNGAGKSTFMNILIYKISLSIGILLIYMC